MKFNVERNTSENTENQFLHASQNFKHFNGKHFDPCAEKYVDPCAENMNNNPAYAYVGGANPAGARDGSSVAELQAEILEFKNLIRNGISKNTFRDVFASYRHIYSLSVELQNNHITQIPKLSLRDHTNFLSILALNKAPINAGNFLLYNLIDILETQDLDSRHFHLILMIFYNAGSFENVKTAFDRIQSQFNQKPTVKAFNILMKTYLAENDLKKVVATWQSCCNAWPALVYLNQDGWAILIEAYSQANHFKEAKSSFEMLQKKLVESSVPIDTCVVDSMIRAFGKANQLQNAISLFESLDIEPSSLTKYQPDTIPSRFIDCLDSYNSIIKACFSSNQAEKALFYFEKTLDMCSAMDTMNGTTTTQRRPLKPNEIDGYCSNCTWFIPEKRHQRGYAKNQAPLVETLTQIIHHHYTHSHFTRVLYYYHFYMYLVRWPASVNEVYIQSCIEADFEGGAVFGYDRMLVLFQRPSEQVQEWIQSIKNGLL